MIYISFLKVLSWGQRGHNELMVLVYYYRGEETTLLLLFDHRDAFHGVTLN